MVGGTSCYKLSILNEAGFVPQLTFHLNNEAGSFSPSDRINAAVVLAMGYLWYKTGIILNKETKVY